MRVLWFVLGVGGLVAGDAAQLARWLRVLQREHYEPVAPLRFWYRWTRPWGPSTPSGRPSLALVGWVLFVAAWAWSLAIGRPWLAVASSVVYGVACPWGLTPRGRTGALRWTRRLRTVAIVAVAISAAVVLVGTLVGQAFYAGALVVVVTPLTVALAAQAMAPWEARLAQGFVDQAAARLRRVAPTVVAITGSYGKTSTKNHLADLLRHDGVVATPKSFNNRAGLSRAINENLADGTRVFVAEMGTYGPGEIRDLCQWCPPAVAVITAIGPVHLERMKTLDVIEAAKFEITANASTVVVNVDDERLARWPDRLGGRVRRAGSTSLEADVRVAELEGRWHVWVDGADVGQMEPVLGVQPTNVACALAAALEVGLTTEDLTARLAAIGPVANRTAVTTAASGVVVIDDTFNANPASARASLDVLSALAVPGRRVAVTPGLIELGAEQGARNEELARDVHQRGVELVVVARTNLAALTRGYGSAVRRFRVRDEAVAWVRASLRAGDAVLYLNDLPDQYP
ncbi:MAG: UDP-N-acetylmuramoyl-tripeptide--D-alanyl-D-alanine ligase [Acidobacteriota bacterium]|nr:UDP-N-acetylmuramoyl-tripeptide--D-alanyl-D-alanine ligase [Acidobacteriota bacterium]